MIEIGPDGGIQVVARDHVARQQAERRLAIIGGEQMSNGIADTSGAFGVGRREAVQPALPSGIDGMQLIAQDVSMRW